MPASDTMAAKLRDLIATVVDEAGFDLEELVEQRVGARTLLRVVVDGDDGVSLDDVAELSQAVSAALDEAELAEPGVLGDKAYDLELSSPGVSRTLTLPRHWRRARGRLVKATGPDGAELTGRVLSSTDDEVTLLVTIVHKPGQKATETERTFGHADLTKAKVQVEFNRAAFEAIEAELAGQDLADGDLADEDTEDDDTDDDDDEN
jgi:ribosome maturation factor RimP